MVPKIFVGSSREDECNMAAFDAGNFAEVLQVLEQVGSVVGLCDGDLEAVRPCMCKMEDCVNA